MDLDQHCLKGAATQTTYFVYGESSLLAEANEQGVITKAYGWNPQVEDMWSTAPLWQANPQNASLSNTATAYHYLHTDHLETPVLGTDKSGMQTWKAISEAFGDTKVDTSSAITMNLRFAGQYFDVESGLHQNYWRDYRPAVGRYVQSDPIGLAGGMNTYAYVGGNPLSFTDPMGLDRWGDDSSLKRIPTNDKSVVDWLCSYGGTGSPTTDLMNGRNNGWDRYDDNLPAAERFAEMMDGNYANYAPWRSDDFNMGQYLYKKYRQGARGGKGNGSQDAGFVAKWGAMGAFYFEQNISWADWKQRNCTCGK